MPLYRMEVLPASTPSAERNVIRIVGPSLSCCWTKIPMPTNAARTGMTQTMESLPRFFGTLSACGIFVISESSVIFPPRLPAGIPDQAGVEAVRRENRQDDHRGEEHHPAFRNHRHERPELDERDDDRRDEHIQHRPPPDGLQHSVQARPLA